MSDNQIDQHLSAMMDDECEASQTRFLLKRYAQCAQTRARWTRMHVARDVLHGAQIRIEAMTLTERVSLALEDEGAPARESAMHRWLKPVAGVAVAATVATVAVMLTRPVDTGTDMLTSPVAGLAPISINTDAATTTANRPQAQLASATKRSAMEDPRLREYVLRHNQVAPNARSGFTQYVYFVTRPAEPVEPAAESDEANP